ncbi:MAG: hypothetical protein AB1938_24165 [Myxococcota bacterium]
MIMRALDALLEDLDVVRWCRTRLKERCPFAEKLALKRTWRERTAHARRALEAIRRDDPEFSRELERTVVADAAPELARRR